MTVRAVNLEVVEEFTAKRFLLVLRKFCAKCGLPKVIYSNKNKQFILNAKMLKKKFLKD